ncbi:hypothetical protein [Microbacterium sp. USTB-Y]|uniref:hypothetical protein n=1 Tax=Microbacterium sp. USTB-Y TaxID=2823692 RepID=UPI00203BE7E5|nr:hypothetical protein [Microbacterium sp. USTB-Y]
MTDNTTSPDPSAAPDQSTDSPETASTEQAPAERSTQSDDTSADSGIFVAQI